MGVCSLCFGLMGPSKILRLPEEIYFILIGLVFNGFTSYFGFVPGLPEAID